MQPDTFSNMQPDTFSNMQPNTFSNMQPDTFSNMQPDTFSFLLLLLKMKIRGAPRSQSRSNNVIN